MDLHTAWHSPPDTCPIKLKLRKFKLACGAVASLRQTDMMLDLNVT
jgi:hypothetical protein